MGVASLSTALRLHGHPQVALVGSGGKTSSLFRLAAEWTPPVWLTATTHLGAGQVGAADRHLVLSGRETADEIAQQAGAGVTVFTGPVGPDGRTSGLSDGTLATIRVLADENGVPLFIEADGSRQKPIKAPADHEPVIPPWVGHVVVVVGLSGLGKPLDSEWVHRPALFSQRSGLPEGAILSLQALRRYLVHPEGGLKNVPASAWRSVFLNQADTPEIRSQAIELAEGLTGHFNSAVVGSLQAGNGFTVCEPVGGVLLAAGGSSRLGRPKQTIEWQGEPLVRRTARLALEAGLSPVIVVTGATAGEVSKAVEGLAVRVVDNPDWQQGQSSSMQTGLRALPPALGGAVFLLSDQPLLQVDLIRRLVQVHRETLAPVVAPRVGDRRANPVLFDRDVFAELSEVRGDVGGRAIFDRHPIAWVPWDDERLLLDIDTPDDYQRFVKMGG